MPRKKTTPTDNIPVSSTCTDNLRLPEDAMEDGGETGDSIDVSSAEQTFHDLLARLQAHQPSPGAVDFWLAQISDAEARANGQRVSSDRVLADAMEAFPAIVPLLVQGPLPGYGPRRAHHALTLCLQLDARYRSYRGVETSKAAASQNKTDALDGAQQRRDGLRHLLTEASRGNSTQNAALAQVTSYNARKPVQMATSIETMADMAKDMLAQAAEDPTLAEVYEDMGLTAEVAAGARLEARQLVGAAGAHGEQKTARSEGSDELNTLDGRVWFELDALKRAVEVARSTGRKVPAVRLSQLDRVRRRKARPATPPSAPPSP